jgi:hypothetical protein
MANIPKRTAGKGTPPPLTKTVGNLSKPEPAGHGTLNLRVPVEFKRSLKSLAGLHGVSMTELIMEGIGLLREQRGWKA